MFIRLLHPQDPPHYFSSASQMEFNTHIERKKFRIPENPRKLSHPINMNTDCGKTILSMPAAGIWYYTSTGRVYQNKRDTNRSWKWYSHGYVMGSNIPSITSQKITPQGRISTGPNSTSAIGYTKSGRQYKRVFNVQINQWHYHYHHWWTNLSGTGQNLALLVIQNILRPLHSSDPLNWDDPLSLRKIEGKGCLTEHKTYMVWGINIWSLRILPPKLKEVAWKNYIKDSLSFKKPETPKRESQWCCIHHTTSTIIFTILRHLLKRGKKWVSRCLLYQHRKELHICKKFIQWVTEKGVPINNTLFTDPNVTLWNNECKYEIEG